MLFVINISEKEIILNEKLLLLDFRT